MPHWTFLNCTPKRDQFNMTTNNNNIFSIYLYYKIGKDNGGCIKNESSNNMYISSNKKIQVKVMRKKNCKYNLE